jgi:parallel beta-helix repeat protein
MLLNEKEGRDMKKISAMIFVCLLLSGMILYFEVGVENASAYTPHAPIYIDGNSDFANQSAIEGWAGDGSQSDPYIIEGYEIDASTAHGIEIRNTSVYYVINDCYIHDGGTSFIGITFYSSSNGEVRYSHLSNNQYGISVYSPSSNNIISNNIIESNNVWGLILDGMSNIVLNNSIHSNTDSGIFLTGGSCTVLNNTIANNFHGISISAGLGNNMISNNRIQFNSNDGINVVDSYDNIISGNTIILNTNYGIYMDFSYDNKIYHNNITSNTNQAYDNSENSWNLDYPGGGNYWDDYIGNDDFSGPEQDISGSDGFGDTPYTDINGSGGAEDMYPLIRYTNVTFGGDILITSHEDGETVDGKILVEAAVTFPDVWGVNFYIDGTFMNFDDISPYQFILDTEKLSEDTRFEIKAEAFLIYGGFETTSIRLWVNNIAEIGDYITVATMHTEYQPDEDISLIVGTDSPPYFETLELEVKCEDPSGHPLYTSIHDFYYGTEYRVIMPIPSDAELGTYTVDVYAFGSTDDTLSWFATNSTTFLVSGTSLKNRLEGLNATLSGMDLTELLDEIQYLNQTLPVKIDDLLSQLSDLDDYVEGFNESLADDIADISSALQLHDKSTGENNSEIKDTLDDLLSGGIGTEALDDLKGMLTDLAGNVSSYNQSIADDILDVVGDIDDFETQMNQKINAINTTLGDIGSTQDELQTSVDDIPTDKQEEGIGLTDGLLIVVIILLVIILLVTLMGRREPKQPAEKVTREESEDEGSEEEGKEPEEA